MGEDRFEGGACWFGHRGRFTIPGAEPSYAPDLALEPVHIEVRLAFDLESERAQGGVTTTIRGHRGDARTLRLDAISLDDVSVSTAEPSDWSYDGRAIRVTWRDAFAEGEERKVEVRYSVTSPLSGMFFSRPDEAYPDRSLLVATDHETERARYWLPCVDYPTVRTTFDFHLTAQEDLTILANGALVEEASNGDGTKTAHWRLEHPCPSYLCCLAIGRFTRFDDESVDGRPVAYFGADRFPAEHLQRSFGRTPKMMRWLQDRLGVAFPFPKYFQIALPEIGGAMENISLVTWDEIFVADEDLGRELTRYIDSVNIHEMAHSYFGDAVVCRHFEHSWLKESWATYVETVYLEENDGRDDAHFDLHLNALRYMEEADSRYVRPIVTRTYNSSWDLFDAHLYPGGAWRIHMVRHLVGDRAFWAATRDYLETFSGKLVETEDFRRKLEEHSGLNLVRFFDQWIYGKGYPKLKASFKHDAEKNEATLVVEQTQKDEKKGIGLFSFPLEVEITDDEGSRRVTLQVESARQSTLLPVRGKPKQVLLDPDCKALFALEFNPGEELLRHALDHAPGIRNRIHAAKELIKTGSRSNLSTVRDAMKAEPFWGVRAAVAKELGDSLAAEAVGVLAELLLHEEDPRAVRSFAAACGRMRDPRLKEALRGILERNPLPWARATALESLGGQRDEADLDRLIRAAGASDLHSVAAGGALRGLGHLRSRRAFEWLEGRLPYGVEAEMARPAAVEAFGRAAGLLDRDSRERAAQGLIDLTRDPRSRVRLRAGTALAALREGVAVPALESLKRLHPAEDTPRIERWIMRLKKGGPGEEETKLREQVEKLEDKCRKLDERIQDLETRAKADSEKTNHRGTEGTEVGRGKR